MLQCTFTAKSYREQSASTHSLRTSVQLRPPFPQLLIGQAQDTHAPEARCLLRLKPTTTTTNLIRLESRKPFLPYYRLDDIEAVLLTLFQPFQIFMNYSSSGKGVKLRMSHMLLKRQTTRFNQDV